MRIFYHEGDIGGVEHRLAHAYVAYNANRLIKEPYRTKRSHRKTLLLSVEHLARTAKDTKGDVHEHIDTALFMFNTHLPRNAKITPAEINH